MSTERKNGRKREARYREIETETETHREMGDNGWTEAERVNI